MLLMFVVVVGSSPHRYDGSTNAIHTGYLAVATHQHNNHASYILFEDSYHILYEDFVFMYHVLYTLLYFDGINWIIYVYQVDLYTEDLRVRGHFGTCRWIAFSS